MYAMYYVAVGSLAALAFAACMFFRVKKEPGGSKEMLGISGAVQKGANAYLKRQYKGVGIFFCRGFCHPYGNGNLRLFEFFYTFCFPDRRIFLRTVRVHRHETATMPTAGPPGASERPEQGPEGCVFCRIRHGVHGGSAWGFLT